MEKEDFFTAAALVLGPPPVSDRRGFRFGTMVGSKGDIESKSYRQHQDEQKYASRLYALYMGATNNPCNISFLFEEYVRWYQLQNKLRMAAEKI